jgi:hypothetical protein
LRIVINKGILIPIGGYDSQNTGPNKLIGGVISKKNPKSLQTRVVNRAEANARADLSFLPAVERKRQGNPDIKKENPAANA